jgi:hypothetical protein
MKTSRFVRIVLEWCEGTPDSPPEYNECVPGGNVANNMEARILCYSNFQHRLLAHGVLSKANNGQFKSIKAFASIRAAASASWWEPKLQSV